MSGTEEFIRQYGDISFTEMPFCDADNVALCEVFYMPLEKVVSPDFGDEPKGFCEVSNDMYNYMGHRHKPLGLMITKNPSVKLSEMSRHRRYAEMQVVACRSVFDIEPAVQFAAATFILPDGTLVIPFRGTDDTLAGWKEDVDIYTRKVIPSYQLAVDYLEQAAENFSGDIIVCGHSKGGNVALYAALNCSQEVRSRIRYLYNNDGPGFFDYSLYSTAAYRELLPKYRHFVPDSSFIGMMLAHDDDFTVVGSTRHLGPMQHDLATWQIDGCEMETKPGLTKMAQAADLGLMEIISRLTDAQSAAIDKVIGDLFNATGEICLLDFAKNVVPAVSGAVRAWRGIDETTKEDFKSAFKGAGKIIKGAVKTVKEETAPAAARRARIIAEKVLANS